MKIEQKPQKQKNNRIHVKDTGVESEVSDDLLPPIFSLEKVEDDDCITKCEKDDRAAFAVAFRKLSQFSWQELRTKDRHGLGYEIINRTSLRRSIPPSITEDVKFIAFRFSGMKSMVGYRDKRIFYIIWFDDSFDVYDHGS